jgi:predicted GIY-YIG superfamily endonuclease
VGFTRDLGQRLEDHNARKARHTRKFVPWRCVVAVRFDDERKARAFERYLKSGSGRAFANRHFW